MKRLLLFFAAVCFSIGIMGNFRVSSEEAQIVATEYYQKIRSDVKGECLAGIPEKISLQGKAEMWFVPVNDSWILVSSDKRTEAILARFDTPEKPDLKTYPPAARYLVCGYEQHIIYVRDSCEDCHVRSSWEEQLNKNTSQINQTNSIPSSVDPLLGEIAWKQSGNNGGSSANCTHTYNKFCPSINTNLEHLCGHASVGCVAVAIGQIMRYWEWPYAARVPTTVGGDSKEMHFYDWSLMPARLYNYTNLERVNMVASFLRDIGYDLDMNYGESSGADDGDALETLVNFGYDENTITYGWKMFTPRWTSILHSEIAAGRPIYYGGYNANGHAFVLDGYDAMGKYHVNYGWGLGYNGFFHIDSIYPHQQSAIWGIQPASSYCTSKTIQSAQLFNFCMAYAGLVTLSGVQMLLVNDGRVYSETGIRLTSGTHIFPRCNIQLAIKPIPCEPPITPANVPEQTKNKVMDVKIINTETGVRELTNLQVFSIDGKLIVHLPEGNLSTISLPNGVYIIKATTDEGNLYQSKILIQK